ncbi:hypothetical protein CR513_00064, partial [Mucuna pruriens]
MHLSSSKDENKEANFYLMAKTLSDDEDDEEVNFNNLEYFQIAYQELLSNSSTLSLGYKELKKNFQKFESLEKENGILKKENEKLKEEQTSDLSKVNILKVNELQREVINLRQSLAKFVKGIRCPKGPSKPTRTNRREPKKIWVPKSMIIIVAYVFNRRKKTPVIIPRQWVLTTHDE